MSIRNAWYNITNLGVDEAKLGREVVKVRILNQIVFVTLMTSTLVLLVYIATNDTLTIILTTLGNISLESAALLAAYNQRHRLARYLAFIVFPTWMGINVMLTGGGFSEANIFSALAFCAFIMFEGEKKLQIPAVVYITSIFITTRLYVIQYVPNLDRVINPYDEIITFPLILVILGLIILLYQREIKKFEKQQEGLINDLARKNQSLIQLNEELEQFAHIASHDLKTPLRTISSHLDLIQWHIKRGQYEAISEDIRFAKQGTQQMYSLINDILEYQQLSHPEEGLETVDLNLIFKKVVAQLDASIQEKKAEISASSLPILKGRAQDMMFLFQNLIENGIKFNQSTTPKVEITSSSNDTFVQLVFKDNGIGIEEMYHDKIFEFFQRLHNNSEYEGTGIGLGLCKKL